MCRTNRKHRKSLLLLLLTATVTHYSFSPWDWNRPSKIHLGFNSQLIKTYISFPLLGMYLLRVSFSFPFLIPQVLLILFCSDSARPALDGLLHLCHSLVTSRNFLILSIMVININIITTLTNLKPLSDWSLSTVSYIDDFLFSLNNMKFGGFDSSCVTSFNPRPQPL